MPTPARIVSIHPYFSVFDGKLNDFRALCEQFVNVTRGESKCLYYGFSFNGNNVHCREAYEGAEGLLEHLSNVDTLLKQALQISDLTRVEIHGAAEELAKLQQPLTELAPTYFTLEYEYRRAS